MELADLIAFTDLTKYDDHAGVYVDVVYILLHSPSNFYIFIA